MKRTASSSLRNVRRLRDFVFETRGGSVPTTLRVLCNKTLYLINHSVRRFAGPALVHARWHWARYPFSLRDKVLWSSALQAWFVPADESAIECMLHMPAYEPIDWIDPRRGEYFLDCGGYVGWYSIQAGRAVGPPGRVLVLEPDSVNRGQLERNLALNNIANAQIIPLAIWSHSQGVAWHPGDEPVWHHVTGHGPRTQKSTSIDDLVETLSLPRLDWIKLDIEGGEVEALRGASRTLKTLRPKLFIEVHETTQAVIAMLDETGYTVTRQLYDRPPNRHGWILAQSP